MTARVVRALRNPHITVLGHPTGRLLLQREAYALDMEAVLAAAARNGVAMEINASPYRLDLDWRWCQRARDKGIVFWVNPDAHSTGELATTCRGSAWPGRDGCPRTRSGIRGRWNGVGELAEEEKGA